MRCLITGGAGFIGSHLAEQLVAEGHAVRVLDDLSTGHRENLAALQESIELQVGSVHNANAVAKAIAHVDWVFHLAALVSVPKSFTDPAGCFKLNTDATLQLAAAAKAAGAQRFVFASSSAVYGDAAVQPIAEVSPTNPLSPYAESKLRAEEGLWPLAEPGRFEPVALRFFNVYGPRQSADSPYSGVIVRFLHQLERGEPITLYGDGEQTRDFIHVSDVAEGLLRAAASPLQERVFNIGTGRAVTLNKLVTLLSEVTGRPVQPRHGPPRAGDVRHSQANIQRAQALLGFQPKVALQDGLADLVSPTRERGGNSLTLARPSLLMAGGS